MQPGEYLFKGRIHEALCGVPGLLVLVVVFAINAMWTAHQAVQASLRFLFGSPCFSAAFRDHGLLMSMLWRFEEAATLLGRLPKL